MTTLALYRQARVDGGLRTGIEVDGLAVWEQFEPGSEEVDPALLWYIDCVCEGDDLPTEADEVRQWFLAQGPALQGYLTTAAQELIVGSDPEVHPYGKVFAGPETGLQARISVSAVRRIVGRGIAARLVEFRDAWEATIRNLVPLASV